MDLVLHQLLSMFQQLCRYDNLGNTHTDIHHVHYSCQKGLWYVVCGMYTQGRVIIHFRFRHRMQRFECELPVCH